MKFFTHSAVFLCLAAALSASPVAQAATVINGDFESGDLTGWTLFGNTALGFVGVDGGSPQAGNYAAYFGPNGSVGGISQVVATTVGAAYDVGFWLKSEADPLGVATPNSFAFSWGSTPAVSLTNLPAGNYIHYTNRLVATSASTAITFTFRDDPAFFDLDTVAVTAVVASVPEPSSVALLAFGGLAVLGYRRRQLKQAPGSIPAT